MIKSKSRLPEEIKKTIHYKLFGRDRIKSVTMKPDDNRDYTYILEHLTNDTVRTKKIAKRVAKVLALNAYNRSRYRTRSAENSERYVPR